jgi:ParB/RepB/Spo0J family partition protein
MVDANKKLLYLPLSQVEVADDSGLRKVKLDSEKFMELRQSVKNRGVLLPIVVRLQLDDQGIEHYILTDGLHRRTAAQLERPNDPIPCVVRDDDEADVLEIQIEANLHKIETRPGEFAKQLQRIMLENPGRTIEEQAKRIGKSKAWVLSRLDLLALPEDVLKMIDGADPAGRVITISNAIALSQLAKEAPDKVHDWVDRAVTQAPDVFFSECLQAVKAAKQEKKGQKVTATGPALLMRKIGEVKDHYGKAVVASSADPSNQYLKGFREALDWMLHQDPMSQAAWARAEKEREEAKAKKEAEKAAKAAAKTPAQTAAATA